MKLTRREFIGAVGAFTVSTSAMAGLFGGKDKGSLNIATLNDIHALDARSTALLSRAVNRINADSTIACTIVLGDLATDGKLGELQLAKTALGRLTAPYYVIPGNHDVDMSNANILANYERCFGPGHWRREEGDWVFLGLDSCEGSASDVTIRPDQVEWLRRQVKHIKPARPIALFTHHPFNPNTKAYRVKNADEILAMFAEHNLKLVASGHYHGNQVETHNGIVFTTTACCASTRDNFDDTPQKGYRIYRLGGDTVETEFAAVEG